MYLMVLLCFTLPNALIILLEIWLQLTVVLSDQHSDSKPPNLL